MLSILVEVVFAAFESTHYVFCAIFFLRGLFSPFLGRSDILKGANLGEKPMENKKLFRALYTRVAK